MLDLYKAIDSLRKINEEVEKVDERVTYRTLAKLSGIKDPNKISIGQKVKLPNGKSYTVKKGDTLSGIAEKYRLLNKSIKKQPKKEPKIDNPMAPPEKKISQKNSPGNPFSPDKKIKPSIDKRLMPITPLNRYALNKDNTYKPITPNLQPDKNDKPSFLDRMQKGFNKFVGNLKNDPQFNKIGKDQQKKYGGLDQKINPKTSNKTANKNMIKRITGANT